MMGYEYALVYGCLAFSRKQSMLTRPPSHLQYTIPPALILTLLYRPLSTAIDVYKVLFLILVSRNSFARPSTCS